MIVKHLQLAAGLQHQTSSSPARMLHRKGQDICVGAGSGLLENITKVYKKIVCLSYYRIIDPITKWELVIPNHHSPFKDLNISPNWEILKFKLTSLNQANVCVGAGSRLLEISPKWELQVYIKIYGIWYIHFYSSIYKDTW